MNDLSLTLFYRTSMDIESIEADGDALWSLVCDIRGWMTRKWQRHGIEIPKDDATWSHFKNGTSFADQNKIVQFYSALYHGESGELKWACSITESIAEEGYNTRKWITEIGFSGDSLRHGAVSLVLSYGDRPGFLGPYQDQPAPTIPGIVGILLADRYLKCTASGVELQREARELKAGAFPSFWKLLSDPERTTPVIFISPRFHGSEPELLVDPQELADILGPSAFVYFTKDRGFVTEMRATIPAYSYRCSNGTVRAYATHPQVDDPTDQYRHRYFTTKAIEDLGADELIAIFRRAYAQDVHYYETMVRVSTVRNLIHDASLTKRNNKKIEDVEKAAIDLAQETEESLKKKTSEAEALKEENDRLKGEMYNLEQKASSYEAAFKYGSPDSEESHEVWAWPRSPRETFEIFEGVCDDRIAFTQRAIDSLEDCQSSPETLWGALHDLRTIGYELYHQGSRNIENEFNAHSKYRFSPSAGMMTRKDKSLMQQYYDEYEGRKINVETHIKSGNQESDPKFIRVYFAYDRESDRIVVSYIGKHLKNYTSRSIH